MGLKSGDTGPKGVFKKFCTDSVERRPTFRRFLTLQEVARGVLHLQPDGVRRATERSEAVVLLDGNVLMMSVPEAVNTLDGFVDIIYGYVRKGAVAAGRLVVVAFDEPEHLTMAKKEEQARRDAARRQHTVTCSTDVLPTVLGPHFTRAELEACANVHALKTDRALKTRLYDEVIRRVHDKLKEAMANFAASGHDPGVLVVDGADPRGCEVPAGERRTPAIYGTDTATAQALAHEAPIGEGDIKLIALESRLRELQAAGDEEFCRYKLCLTSTTDTDTFMTMLLDTAKRRLVPDHAADGVALHSLFCMREPPSKRDRDATDGNASATFLACDTMLLEDHLQTHLWSKASGGAAMASAPQKLHAMLALSGAAALCGCDFTLGGLKGARFDHFFESLPGFIATEPNALGCFGSALAREPVVARTACKGLLRVCYTASQHMETKPRYKKQAQTVWDVSDTLLRRAVWALAYWSQNEFADEMREWGFNPPLELPING